jgi:hypothetical protein
MENAKETEKRLKDSPDKVEVKIKDEPGKYEKYSVYSRRRELRPTWERRRLDPKEKPKPRDLEIKAVDVLFRVVPEVDNLLEVAVYLNSAQFTRVKKHVMQVKNLELDFGAVIRRGRKNKATNIFIYGE